MAENPKVRVASPKVIKQIRSITNLKVRGIIVYLPKQQLQHFRFYDVGINAVEVLAIITKSKATKWLGEAGE